MWKIEQIENIILSNSHVFKGTIYYLIENFSAVMIWFYPGMQYLLCQSTNLLMQSFMYASKESLAHFHNSGR